MSKTLIWRYLKIVTRFSPPWPPFSFSTGPLDPSVEYAGKNIATMRYNSISHFAWGVFHREYVLLLKNRAEPPSEIRGNNEIH